MANIPPTAPSQHGLQIATLSQQEEVAHGSTSTSEVGLTSSTSNALALTLPAPRPPGRADQRPAKESQLLKQQFLIGLLNSGAVWGISRNLGQELMRRAIAQHLNPTNVQYLASQVAGGTFGLALGAAVITGVIKPWLENTVGVLKADAIRAEDVFPYPENATLQQKTAVDEKRKQFEEAQKQIANHAVNDMIANLSFIVAQPAGKLVNELLNGTYLDKLSIRGVPVGEVILAGAKLATPSAIGGALTLSKQAQHRIDARFEGKPLFRPGNAPANEIVRDNFRIPNHEARSTAEQVLNGLGHFATHVLGGVVSQLPAMLVLHGTQFGVAHLAAAMKGKDQPQDNRVGIQQTGNSAIDLLAPMATIGLALMTTSYFAGIRLMKFRADHNQTPKFLARDTGITSEERARYRDRNMFGAPGIREQLLKQGSAFEKFSVRTSNAGSWATYAAEGVADAGVGAYKLLRAASSTSAYTGGVVANRSRDAYAGLQTLASRLFRTAQPAPMVPQGLVEVVIHGDPPQQASSSSSAESSLRQASASPSGQGALSSSTDQHQLSATGNSGSSSDFDEPPLQSIRIPPAGSPIRQSPSENLRNRATGAG